MNKSTLAVLFLAFLLPFSSGGVLAQDVLEEIVVTAQKRAESVQDIPISITAFSGDALREYGAVSSRDLASITPNMNWAGNEGQNVGSVFLRGVGDFSFHSNQVGAVGVYVDEVSQNSPILQNFALFDLERVEILRGPQNTLFGRNTTAGAIQYISRKPELGAGTNGYVTLTGGNEGRFDVEAGGGMSLSENVAARLAVTRVSQGDYIDNLNPGRGDEGAYERYGARGQLLFKVSEDMEILFNVHGGVYHGDSTRYKSIGSADPATGLSPTDGALPCPTFTPNPGNGCSDQTGLIDTADPTENFSGEPNIFDTDTHGGSVNIKWDLGWAELTSVTALENVRSFRAEDTVPNPGYIFTFHQDIDVEQWSQEIRLASPEEDRLRWIGGFYYFNEDALLTTAVSGASFAFDPTIFVPLAPVAAQGPKFIRHTKLDQENEVFSVYGQGEYEVTDKLTFTAGLRYSHERKRGNLRAGVTNDVNNPFAISQKIDIPFLDSLVTGARAFSPGPASGEVPQGSLFVNCNFGPPVDNCFFNAPYNFLFEDLGGKLALDYQMNEDMLLYASVSRGFKGGGLSVAALDALTGVGGSQVDSEYLTTYEAGLKSQWLGNTLQFNAAFFWNEWTDQQLFLITSTPTGPAPVLTNVPESSSKGVELDMQWIPAEGWSTMFGLSYTDSSVDDAGTLGGGVVKGNKLVGSPEITFNGLIRKEWPVANGTFSLQTDFRYTDDVEYDLGNNPALAESDYWMLNARASYRFGPGERYEISVWGKNLTDTEYCALKFDLNGLGFGNVYTCQANEGMPFYGGTFTARYN